MPGLVSLRVHVEKGIPKLLVKANLRDVKPLCIANLDEVYVGAGRPGSAGEKIAVLSVNAAVPADHIVLSSKLAEMLCVAEGDTCTVAPLARAEEPSRPELFPRSQTAGPGTRPVTVRGWKDERPAEEPARSRPFAFRPDYDPRRVREARHEEARHDARDARGARDRPAKEAAQFAPPSRSDARVNYRNLEGVRRQLNFDDESLSDKERDWEKTRQRSWRERRHSGEAKDSQPEYRSKERDPRRDFERRDVDRLVREYEKKVSAGKESAELPRDFKDLRTYARERRDAPGETREAVREEKPDNFARPYTSNRERDYRKDSKPSLSSRDSSQGSESADAARGERDAFRFRERSKSAVDPELGREPREEGRERSKSGVERPAGQDKRVRRRAYLQHLLQTIESLQKEVSDRQGAIGARKTVIAEDGKGSSTATPESDESNDTSDDEPKKKKGDLFREKRLPSEPRGKLSAEREEAPLDPRRSRASSLGTREAAERPDARPRAGRSAEREAPVEPRTAPAAEPRAVTPEGRRCSAIVLCAPASPEHVIKRDKGVIGRVLCDSGKSKMVERPTYSVAIPEDFAQWPAGSLEKSELAESVALAVVQWMRGRTSGRHVSAVVVDSGCCSCRSLLLGDCLRAIVGGAPFDNARAIQKEVFAANWKDALLWAGRVLGVDCADPAQCSPDSVSLAYRRKCLMHHPNRGGSNEDYFKLQLACDVVRAACEKPGEGATPVHVTDTELRRELAMSADALKEDDIELPRLCEFNRAFDDYILRLMRFKSELIDAISQMHESSAYAILGVDANATDGEIRKAYFIAARENHPDKGGDKQIFQDLNNAYEKIMGQRRGSTKETWEEPAASPAPDKDRPKKKEAEEKEESEKEAEPEDKKEEQAKDAEQEPEAKEEDLASLREKMAKAAEEASKFANTAADFAHQAADAASTAQKTAQNGSIGLVRSVVHSAIVLSLTVVKAVRIVGYSALDVSSAALQVSKQAQSSAEAATCAASAMSLGFEALQAASAAASATEQAAAKLQGQEDIQAEDLAEAAYVTAQAATAAASSAVAAALAAAEAHKVAVDAVPEEKEAEKAEEPAEKKEEDKEEAQEKKEKKENSKRSKEVWQRVNNWKLAVRLNSELLSQQHKLKEILLSNKYLLPSVTHQQKQEVFTLVKEYCEQTAAVLRKRVTPCLSVEEVVAVLDELLLSSPIAQSAKTDPVLAISTSVGCRYVKLAALLDVERLSGLIAELLAPLGDLHPRLAEWCAHVAKTLSELVAM